MNESGFFSTDHPLNALQVAPCDRRAVLTHLDRTTDKASVFYWHPNLSHLQKWEAGCLLPCPEKLANELQDIAEVLPANSILACDILDLFPSGPLEKICTDLHFRFAAEGQNRRLLAIGQRGELPDGLRPLIPCLDWQSLGKSLILEGIATLQKQYSPEHHTRLQMACQGLSAGEISETILRWKTVDDATEQLSAINRYKAEKLQGDGVELLPAPDVPDIGGADLLQKDFDDIAKLFLPDAAAMKLRPPKAGLFVGLPGTGKTLMAKLASQVCSVPLLTTSLSLLRRESAAASIANLERVFAQVGQIGPSFLFLDELDKGLGKWEDDFILAKMAERLLVWAENHTEPVCLLAAVNRVEKLPAELLARFEYAWFFDLPHLGALYEIFCLQLKAWNPDFDPKDWDVMEWRSLLESYRGCVGREIAQAVKRVQRARYCRGEKELAIPFEELIQERRRFRAASEDPAVADQIANMRAKGQGLRPVCSRDTSIFARQGQSYITVFNISEEKEGNDAA